jgi:hypothetical protein
VLARIYTGAKAWRWDKDVSQRRIDKYGAGKTRSIQDRYEAIDQNWYRKLTNHL